MVVSVKLNVERYLHMQTCNKGTNLGEDTHFGQCVQNPGELLPQRERTQKEGQL